MLNKIRNRKGFALIWAGIVTTFMSIMLSSFYMMHAEEIKYATSDASKIQAFYLAESGLDKKLSEINTGNYNAISQTSFGNGTYQVAYDSTTKTITSTGICSGVTKSITATITPPSASMPPGVKAATTSGSSLIVILGLTIDGREYNASGNLTGNSGTYGISYGDDPTFDGLVLPKIGGNGVAPTQPVPAQVKKKLSSEEVGALASVNTVLGLPADSTALNAYKSTSAPSSPLNHSIYYYTPSTSGSLLFPGSTINLNGGSGILIIDNATHESWVKLTGTFTGLVICDNCRFDKNASVTGAVVSVDQHTGWITGYYADDQNDFAEIKYSPEVLQSLPAITGGAASGGQVAVKQWTDNDNGTGRI